MSLLGLMIGEVLRLNLADPKLQARAVRLDGDVHVAAGDMRVTLRFAGGRVKVLSGASDRPRASVAGNMPDLLGVVTGQHLVSPVVTGRIRLGGNPFYLLRMLPLIRR